MLPQIILRPLKSIAFALILGAALAGGASTAFAGAGELTALKTALAAQVPSVTDIAQASSQQLLDAFVTVALTPGSKYNTTKAQGIVAGEALKAAGPNATNAGEFFGQKIKAATGADPLVAIYTDRNNFVAVAASTAGAGKGLNVSQIPGLAAETFAAVADSTNAQFTSVALLSKSKAGQGAIIGGRARQIFDNSPATAEADSAVLANKAIFDTVLLKATKLNGAAQDIARWIAAEFGANAADSAGFAVNFAGGNGDANLKVALKIATGASAGDSTNAGNIVHNLFGQQVLDSSGTYVAAAVAPSANLKNTMVKGATMLVKTVSAVADIEEIQKVGNAIGKLMATPNPAKPTVGLLTLSKAASTVKTLATAVMSKPRGNNTISDRNSDKNKQDEIAEVAAYMIGGFVGSPEFTLPTDPTKVTAFAAKAAKTLLGVVTSAAQVKPKVVKTVAQGPSPDLFAADVTASVAWTVLKSALPSQIQDEFKKLLLLPDGKGGFKTLAKINKATGGPNGAIITALNDVYAVAPANPTHYEDGGDPIRAVSDPETDSRPFSGTAGSQS